MGYGAGIIKELEGAHIGSTYRSPEEQDDLHRRGKTPLKGGESAHNRGTAELPGAIDISRIGSGQEARVKQVVEKDTGRKVKKIIWESGKGKNQGTAPHYHVEFEDGSSTNVGASGGSQVATQPARDLSTIQASESERARMNEPRVFITDANTESRMVEAHAESGKRLSAADAILQDVVVESPQMRAEKVDNLRGVVEVKKRINEVNRESTEQFMENVQPIWDQNVRIAERRRELAGMNPLRQAVASIFDPNYDDSYLRAMERGNNAALAAYGERYEGMFQAQATLANLAAMDANDQNALIDLQLDNMGEDVRLALQSYNLGKASLDQELDGLNADISAIQARNTMRLDTVNGLTIGQVNAGIDQAKANGGVATINGVDIRQSDLEERFHALQSRELDMENLKLAIETQRDGLIEKQQERVVETMTEAELRQAIGANGMFEGVQFDVVKLGERLAKVHESKGVAAASMDQTGLKGRVFTMIEGYEARRTAAWTRARGLFGSVPGELADYTTAATAELASLTKGFREAEEAGLGDQYIQQNWDRWSSLQAGLDKVITSAATKWAGGNKSLESLANAWMTGTPLNADAAVDGLIHIAENGLPSGVRMEGPAGAVFRVVQEEVRAAKQAPAGTSVTEALEGGESEKERRQALKERIRSRIRDVYDSQVLNSVLDRAPELARNVTVNGKPHPFSQVDNEDMQTAIRMGDAKGYQIVANRLGITEAQVQKMFNEAGGGNIWKELQGGLKEGENTYEYWEGVLLSAQTMQTLNYLDTSDSGQRLRGQGMRASTLYKDLLRREGFVNQASNANRGYSYGTIGGFLVNQAGGTATDVVTSYGDTVTRAHAARNEQNLANVVERQDQMLRDPFGRLSVALTAVEGLNRADENALLAAVKQQVGNFNLIENPELGQYTGPAKANEAIDSFILNGKFDDPVLESMRRKAAKDWPRIRGMSEGMLARIEGDN